MQQFVVPQFIDIESKILGPITTRQFLWVIAAGLIFFVALRTLSTGPFLIVSIFDVVIFGSFAFLKINGQLFHYFLLNFIQFLKLPKLYMWSIGSERPNDQESKLPKIEAVPVQRSLLSGSRLSELSLIVDTGGSYQPLESFK